ncbi:hypothetical protein TCAL_04276 [Tigriopus californicus]|uniref:JmjC domain-containing protein n=1 Tax=Tigriopus californicus TaxID=6832 RepID=A0A553NCD3_TIGCA|nr:uncharacterized protein LOC131888014 [Tigriopus californicus]TRY63112.1 hypothetical protein TCAL_04276 [Tigriopus californicus]
MCEYITEWPPPDSSDSAEVDLVADPTCQDQAWNPYLEDMVRLKDMTGPDSANKKSKLDWDDAIPDNARLSLAKWARQNQGLASKSDPSTHVKTRLNRLKKTHSAVQFLAQQILTILANGNCHRSKATHFMIASYFHELGWYDSALKAIQLASAGTWKKPLGDLDRNEFGMLVENTSDEEREVLWWHEKLRLQCQMRAKARDRLDVKVTAQRQVARVDGKDLSVATFRQDFVRAQKPVIITRTLSRCVKESWTWDLIRTVAGQKEVVLKRWEKDSLEWARLEPSVTSTVDNFITGIQQRDEKVMSLYLFDWSLPLFCPELNRLFEMPEYFRHDYLKMTPDHALYRQSWPSLFIAPKGVRGGLHIDAFASNFWMMLLQGRKKWTFFDPEVVPHLKPCYDESFDPVFDQDMEDSAKLTALGAFEIILEPGEILFVPRGSPHQVDNLEDSVAVSGNFVDDSNFEETIQHLKINGLLDPRALDLLNELSTVHSKVK